MLILVLPASLALIFAMPRCKVNLRNSDLSKLICEGEFRSRFAGAIFVSSKLAQTDQFIQKPYDSRFALVEGVDFSKAKNLDAKQLPFVLKAVIILAVHS